MKALLNKLRYLYFEVREPLSKGDALLVAFISTVIFGLLLLAVMLEFYYQSGQLSSLNDLKGVMKWE